MDKRYVFVPKDEFFSHLPPPTEDAGKAWEWSEQLQKEIGDFSDTIIKNGKKTRPFGPIVSPQPLYIKLTLTLVVHPRG